ncbi:hypothetical protein RsoM2USA_281 [Ralstonia phage RsoM2USA]|nr:hypothetical protein RsoM2USA_281 [Ralstonia phage RsoM2USA]
MKLEEITQDNEALCDWLMQNAQVHFGSGYIKQRERLLKLLDQDRMSEAAVHLDGKPNSQTPLELPYALPRVRWLSVANYIVPDVPFDSVYGYQFTNCVVPDSVVNNIRSDQALRSYSTKIKEDIFYHLVSGIRSLEYHIGNTILKVTAGEAVQQKGYSKTAKIVVMTPLADARGAPALQFFDDVFEMQDWMIQNGFTGSEYFK